MKLTVIYNKNWMSGSHHHSLTKYARVDVDESKPVLPQIIEIVESEDIVFIFEGWPNHHGE